MNLRSTANETYFKECEDLDKKWGDGWNIEGNTMMPLC